MFLHIYCLITWYCNEHLKFANLQIFSSSDYYRRAKRLSKNVSNVIDLYHNEELEQAPPPQDILGKPDVSLNRVNDEIN